MPRNLADHSRGLSRIRPFPQKNVYRQMMSYERGTILMEFAIVLPLIFLMFVGAFEFSRLFQVKEMMTLASREAAHEAFRECFDTERQVCEGSVSKIDACLTLYARHIDETVRRFLPKFTLTVSMYVWDPETETAEMIGITLDADSNATRTDYDEPTVKGNFRDLLENQEVIVIGEAYYDFPLLFNLGIVPDMELYDVTIF